MGGVLGREEDPLEGCDGGGVEDPLEGCDGVEWKISLKGGVGGRAEDPLEGWCWG